MQAKPIKVEGDGSSTNWHPYLMLLAVDFATGCFTEDNNINKPDYNVDSLKMTSPLISTELIPERPQPLITQTYN